MTTHNDPPSIFPYEPWVVNETAWLPERYRDLEGIFALANGYLGQRASFEEGIGTAVASLRGNYIAGVFDNYPNAVMIPLKGRPLFPSEMVNIPDYLPLLISIDGQPFDLSTCEVTEYRRTLQMERGVLERDVVCRLNDARHVRLRCTRFLSHSHKHIAVIRVEVTPLDFSATIVITSQVNGAVSNLTHQHLADQQCIDDADGHGLTCHTRGSAVDLAVLAREHCAGESADAAWIATQREYCSERSKSLTCAAGQAACCVKIIAVATSRDVDGTGNPIEDARKALRQAAEAGYTVLLAEQETAWAMIWRDIDINIEERSGAGALTQGLHYSVFQMMQNAPNDDPSVNIGAKGLTGEHYYGTYFWDTEIFMIPFFAFTHPTVARDLLSFRARNLPAARAKAQEMGLAGAAFPWMSDADGRECCTLWQFGLMSVHVTAAVAWGVWFYYSVTGDLSFIAEEGIDLMVETSRFWLSRLYYAPAEDRYHLHRVVGPDEYHQGVDNNFYTNIMVQENLLKCCVLLDQLRERDAEGYRRAAARLALRDNEPARFLRTAERIYLPYDAEKGIHRQDDSFHHLEPYDLQHHPPGGALPQVWSYDRIMRTQLLRQADVLIAHLLLGNRFTREELTRDFDYYEPITTHDSSLSFCTYSIVAAALRRMEMAYRYFLHTARLDLDDTHGNSWMGVHTACLAGAWQCLVFGFAGVRWYDGTLSLDPVLPEQWTSYTFSIRRFGARITVAVERDTVLLVSDAGDIPVLLAGKKIIITSTPRRYQLGNSN